MRCNRIAIYGWKSKFSIKNKSRILFSTLDLSKINPALYKTWIIDHQEPCSGEIESQIELEFIPYYGGADPNIEIRFKCKKCGYEFAGDNGLPYNVDTLNKFLTEVVSKL